MLVTKNPKKTEIHAPSEELPPFPKGFYMSVFLQFSWTYLSVPADGWIAIVWCPHRENAPCSSQSSSVLTEYLLSKSYLNAPKNLILDLNISSAK